MMDNRVKSPIVREQTMNTDFYSVTSISGSGSNEKVWDLGSAKPCMMTCASALRDSSNEYVKFYYSDDNSTFTEISATSATESEGTMFYYVITTEKHRYWKTYRKHYGTKTKVCFTITYNS